MRVEATLRVALELVVQGQCRMRLPLQLQSATQLPNGFVEFAGVFRTVWAHRGNVWQHCPMYGMPVGEGSFAVSDEPAKQLINAFGSLQLRIISLGKCSALLHFLSECGKWQCSADT